MIDKKLFNSQFKDKQFDYLKVLDYTDNDKIVCQCVCGKKVLVLPSYLLDKKIKKSCGCPVTKQQLPALHNLYSRFSENEKSNWNGWEDFVIWSKQNGYSTQFSIHKINRKLPYSKENLEFGIFVNKEFFSVIDLKNGKYYYNEKKNKFVTSRRINGKMTSFDEVTEALNKTNNRHKTIPTNSFLTLKFRTKKL